MADLTTLAKVKLLANIAVANNDSDGKINQIIPWVTSIIHQAAGRPFDTRTLTAYKTQAPRERQTRLFIYHDKEDIGLQLFPIITLTLLKENGATLVEGTDYFLERSTGAIVSATGFWTTEREKIEITGTFGFAVVPLDVEGVATEMVASIALLISKTFVTPAGEEQTVTFATAREYAATALGARMVLAA